MKKPPNKVTSISGRFAPDVLDDTDYEVAVKAQRAVLRAQEDQREVLDELRSRLLHGATDNGQTWYFDFDLGIVRRRERQKETGTE